MRFQKTKAYVVIIILLLLILTLWKTGSRAYFNPDDASSLDSPSSYGDTTTEALDTVGLHN